MSINVLPALLPGPLVPQKSFFREGFGFFKNTLKDTVKNVSDRVSKILDKNVFQPYQHDGLDRLKNTSFQTLYSEKKSANFEKLPIKNVFETAIDKPVNISGAKETTFFLKAGELPTLNRTKFYTPEGICIAKLPTGTKIIPDTTKPILIKNRKTYTAVQGHNATPYKESVIDAGYIETPWLGSKIKKENVPLSPSKKNLFSGYIGSNGKEIPAYILKSVTINYFGKNIIPKLQASINQVDADIVKNRGKIKAEFLEKKIALEKIPSYQKQKNNLAKKGSLTKINQAIQSFTMNETDTGENADIGKVIKSLQKTPEWQKVLQQATYIEDQKIRKRYKI